MEAKVRYIPMFMLLSACAGISEIVPTGPDTYVVQARRHGILREGTGGIEVLKRANAFCAAQNRTMVAGETNVSGNPALGFEVTRLTFSCQPK